MHCEKTRAESRERSARLYSTAALRLLALAVVAAVVVHPATVPAAEGRVRILAGASRYYDSDRNDRVERRISIGDVKLSVELEEVRARDRNRAIDVERLRFAARWLAADRLSLRAGLGAASVTDGVGERDTYPDGYLGAQGALGRLSFRAELQREVLDETVLILDNRIRRTQAELFTALQVDDRWRLELDAEYADYSDDNEGWKVELTPQYALRIRDPGLRLGYRHIQSGFERQSGGGYFDPSHLHANYAVLMVTRFGQTLRGDLEIFAGEQVATRSGRRQRDNVLGGSGRLAIDFGPHLTAEMELEGGNFSLQAADGFRYHLLTLNLVGFF